MTIPSQSCLSGEGCHWFDIGFFPDVFIPDVVHLGIASSPSLHSHTLVCSFCVSIRPTYVTIIAVQCMLTVHDCRAEVVQDMRDPHLWETWLLAHGVRKTVDGLHAFYPKDGTKEAGRTG